jgi:hypothetical protein
MIRAKEGKFNHRQGDKTWEFLTTDGQMNTDIGKADESMYSYL